MSTSIDYAAILYDLEAKKTAIDAMIVSVRAAMAAGTLGAFDPSANPGVPPQPSQTASSFSGDIPSTIFKDKSIPEATKLYLSMVNKKQTTKEITEALQEGGMHTTSDSFIDTVSAGLFRASKKFGEIVKVKGSWGLAEWYKGMRVGPQESKPPAKSTKPKKVKVSAKRARRKAAPIPKTDTAQVSSESTRDSAQPGKPPQMEIERYIDELGGADFSVAEVAKALKIRSQTVALLLSRMVISGRLEKFDDGKYRVDSNVQQMPLAG